MLKNKTNHKVLEEGWEIINDQDEEFNCLYELDDLNNRYNRANLEEE